MPINQRNNLMITLIKKIKKVSIGLLIVVALGLPSSALGMNLFKKSSITFAEFKAQHKALDKTSKKFKDLCTNYPDFVERLNKEQLAAEKIAKLEEEVKQANALSVAMQEKALQEITEQVSALEQEKDTKHQAVARVKKDVDRLKQLEEEKARQHGLLGEVTGKLTPKKEQEAGCNGNITRLGLEIAGLEEAVRNREAEFNVLTADATERPTAEETLKNAQAQVAAKAKELQEERALLLQLTGDITTLENNEKFHQKEYAKHDREIATLKKNLEGVELAALKREYAEAERKFNEAVAQKNEKAKDLGNNGVAFRKNIEDSFRAQHAAQLKQAQEAAAQQLADQRTQLEKTITDLEQEKTTLQAKVTTAANEKAALQKQLTDAEVAKNQAEQAKKELEAQKTAKEEEEAKKQADALGKQLQEAQDKLNAAPTEDEKTRAQAELAKLQKAKTELEQKAKQAKDDYEKRLENAQKTLEALRKDVSDSEAKLQAASQNADANKADLESKIKQLETEKTTLTDQLKNASKPVIPTPQVDPAGTAKDINQGNAGNGEDDTAIPKDKSTQSEVPVKLADVFKKLGFDDKTAQELEKNKKITKAQDKKIEDGRKKLNDADNKALTAFKAQAKIGQGAWDRLPAVIKGLIVGGPLALVAASGILVAWLIHSRLNKKDAEANDQTEKKEAVIAAPVVANQEQGTASADATKQSVDAQGGIVADQIGQAALPEKAVAVA